MLTIIFVSNRFVLKAPSNIFMKANKSKILLFPKLDNKLFQRFKLCENNLDLCFRLNFQATTFK